MFGIDLYLYIVLYRYFVHLQWGWEAGVLTAMVSLEETLLQEQAAGSETVLFNSEGPAANSGQGV